jgi:SH3-like domain-containing protein
VRIVEERGTWARVQSASGAEGWMNASFLERMT